MRILHMNVIIVLSLLLLSSLENEALKGFSENVICDVANRLAQGCSREISTAMSLIQCIFACNLDGTCIGAGVNAEGKCFSHQLCSAITTCTATATDHTYMSKDCPYMAWNTSNAAKCFPANCGEWRKLGVTTDGDMIIDPDGPGEDSLAPVVAFCDMTSQSGVGVTIIGHNREAKKYVSGYENPYSYKTTVTYNIELQQILTLISQSGQCLQHFIWECRGSIIYNPGLPLHYTGWYDVNGNMNKYFPPADADYKCSCSSNNTCTQTQPYTIYCNCDNNDGTLRRDDGFVTDKALLPIKGFAAGDTGSSSEYGYHTIGRLQCW